MKRLQDGLLPVLTTSGGIVSFPGAFPQDRQSMAMVSSSSVGVCSSSSVTANLARGSRALSVMIF